MEEGLLSPDDDRWAQVVAVTEAAAQDFAEPTPPPQTLEEKTHVAALAQRGRDRMYWNRIRRVVDGFHENPN